MPVYTAYSNPSHNRSGVQRVYLNPDVCVSCLRIILRRCIILSSSLYISVYSFRSLTRDNFCTGQ